MPKLGIAEILEKVSKEKDPKRRVQVLLDNDSPVLRHFLRIALTPGVQWLLPPGTPPFEANKYLDQQGNLYAEWKRFYLFFPGGNDNLSQTKRELTFIQILESIDPKDAALLCEVKDGKMPYEHVTSVLVETAFPGLIQIPAEKTVETS